MNVIENKQHCKPIELDLCTIDGNAFALMGAFNRAATRQGRTKDEIKAVLEDCQSGDYNHLVSVLLNHTF